MADYGKLNFSSSFNPTSAFPLDARCHFDSITAAQEAALTAQEVGSTDSVYYIGQTLVVVENGRASLFIIQPDKSLLEIGNGGGIVGSQVDYNASVINKPHINGVELKGDLTSEILKLQGLMKPLTNYDIDEIFN